MAAAQVGAATDPASGGSAAPAAAAGTKPAPSTAKTGGVKKPSAKGQRKRNPSTEWHGEAAPREVVPGEKVLDALLELGSQQMSASHYEQALKAFTDAVQRAPLEPRPLYMRGACYQKMGRLKEAEEDFRGALDKDPKGSDDQTVRVRTELGAVLTDSGRPAEAIEYLERAARDKPDMFEATYNLGVAHEALKHWPEAIAAYERATQLKPIDPNPRANQADAYYNLGSVLRKAGRLEDSIKPTREAVQLAPDRPYTHLNLALFLSDAKRYDEAVTEMTAAIQLAEGLSRNAATAEEREDAQQLLNKAWWRLGVIHIRREAPSEAIAALEKAKSLKPTAEVLTDLGLARRNSNDLPRAEAEFRAALQLNPGLGVARLYLASTLATTGRCPEGLRELAQIQPEPTFVETINRIKARCDYERQMQGRRQ
jgi:tetratricopeptide (TPR) repeat protein